MSAAGRGAGRAHLDHYATPAEAVRPLLPFLPASDLVIDAGCGSGAISRVVAGDLAGVAYVLGVEIDEAHRIEAGLVVDEFVCADFLGWDDERAKGALVVTNPPYSAALGFVARALEIVGPAGHVAALVRLGFLASRKRRDWWRMHPADVIVLSARPSFTGDGKTDSADYCWCVWGPGPRGTWRVA